MKKVKVYLVAPESLWGEDRETKRAAQLEALEALGLKETTSGHVAFTADQVVSLIRAGYCGPYRQWDNVEEAGEFDAGPECVSKMSGTKTPEADGWISAAEFPPKAGRYEVHGAPQGKREFYFDGAHWHLHDESRTDLDVRSYGCPGPLWRPASAP